MRTTITRTFVALATAAAAAAVLVVPGSAVAEPGKSQAELSAARQYTAALQDTNLASNAGWVDTDLPCFDNPGSGDNNGGMGVHWIRPDDNLTTAPDASRPNILVFDPVTLKLVAVEYVVQQSAVASTPSLFGQQFGKATLPNGVAIYELHAWIWKPNPNGMFMEFNPTVHLCP